MLTLLATAQLGASLQMGCARRDAELTPVGYTPAAATLSSEPSSAGARDTGANDAGSNDAGADAASTDAQATVAAPQAPWASTQTAYRIQEFPRGNLIWQLLNRVNWQARAAGESPMVGQALTASTSECPLGMRMARGNFVVDARGREDTDDVLLAQNDACAGWRLGQKGMFGVCERFDAAKWNSALSKFQRKPLAVCIDQFEFPNRFGEYPLIVTTFAESKAYCAAGGKRLCTESEWTFACEGELALPYPYGFARDAEACRIDVAGPGIQEDTFNPRTTPRTADGLGQAWRGLRSGERPNCISTFGVQDLTGNVDEWTTSVRTWGYPSILKGGYWGRVRTRCRPQTRAHGPMFVTYEQGFRCCQDPATTPAQPTATGAR